MDLYRLFAYVLLSSVNTIEAMEALFFYYIVVPSRVFDYLQSYPIFIRQCDNQYSTY